MENIAKDFQFAVKETAPCVVEITVTAGPEVTDKYIRQSREEYVKQVRLPGFRQGKIPAKMLEAHYGQDILARAQEMLVRSSIDAALRDCGKNLTQSVDLASQEPKTLEAGKEFKYVVKAEYYPEVKLPELKSIQVKEEAVVVTDEDVETSIKGWLQYKSKLEKQERPAQAEDLLQVNYSCDAPAEYLADSFKGHHALKAEKSWLMLREPEMIPGAIAALTGASAGESRDFPVTFPADHYNEELRGKSFNYHVEVLEVQGYVVPELTDELSREAGAENAEDLRKKARASLEAGKTQEAESKCKEEIMQKLSAGIAELPLPPSMLEEARKFQLQKLEKDKAFAEKSQAEKEAEALKQATEEVRMMIIMKQVMSEHAPEISVSQEEWGRAIQYLAYQERVTPETLLNRIKGTRRLEMLQYNLLHEKALDFLFKNVDVQKA